MLTKITIISCETCGRIVTRSRIDGFPSSLADAVTAVARAAMIGGPRCRRLSPHDMAAGYPFGDRDFGLVRVSRIADERADFL